MGGSRSLAAVAAGLISVAAGAAWAGPVLVGTEDASQYGMLNQRTLAACGTAGNTACGPAATVNSFIYLQNKYPKIYDHKLVPNTPTGPQDTANALAQMMGCTGCGTTLAGLLAGKKAYIEGGKDAGGTQRTGVLPGVTRYESASDPHNINFLLHQLDDGEDVEMIYGYYTKTTDAHGNVTYTRNGGHWVTVTGAEYNDNNANGKFDAGDTPRNFSYVDPYGADTTTTNGAIFQKQIALYSTIDVGPALGGELVDISGLDAGNTVTLIDGVVAESPIPEPASILLLAGALVGLGAARRR